jgi:hypothetical protein
MTYIDIPPAWLAQYLLAALYQVTSSERLAEASPIMVDFPRTANMEQALRAADRRKVSFWARTIEGSEDSN